MVYEIIQTVQRTLIFLFKKIHTAEIICALHQARRRFITDGLNVFNQLLQLCTARKVFSILVTVRLYTVMPEMCRWLTNEK